MFAWKEWERKRKEHRLHVCGLTDWHKSMAQCVFTPVEMLGLWYYWICCLVMSGYRLFPPPLPHSPFVSSCVTLCPSSHVLTSAPVLHLLHWVETLHWQSHVYMASCSDAVCAVLACRRSISYLAEFMTSNSWWRENQNTIHSIKSLSIFGKML